MIELEKINFKNGASGKTPLHKTNLNKLQDNMQKAINNVEEEQNTLREDGDLVRKIKISGASEQEGTPSIDSEAPIESVGDNINCFPTDETEWEQGGVSSSTGENISNVARLRTKNYINIPNNQCYVSIENTNYVFLNILMYDKNNAFVGACGNIDYSIVGSTSLAVTFPSECKKIKPVIKKSNDGTILPSEISTIKPKLEKGTKATPYREYGQGSIGITMGDGTTSQTKALYTQQPFRAIGDIKDRFVKQNGVWYEEHKIERLILNGTENWGKSSNTNNNIFYIQSIFNTLINKGISNYFTYQIVWDVDKVGVEIYNNRNLRFGLGLNSDITTLEQWKAKVVELYNAGTPVYVDYVLAEPTLIECTPEQVEVLNDIYSAYGEGMTNIICKDEVEPVIEIVKETKETVQSENDKAISLLLARIEELEKKIQ